MTNLCLSLYVHVYVDNVWRVNTPRKQGGLGPMKIPLLADKTLEITKSYGVLKEDEGIAFRYGMVICYFEDNF